MNDIKEFTNIYITYNNSNIEGKLREVITSSASANDKFKSIQQIMAESKKELFKLKQLISNNANLISNDKAVELSNKIEHMIDSLSTIDSGINDLLASVTNDKIQNLQSHIDKYDEEVTSLDSMMFNSLEKYQENLYFAVKNGAVTSDDLGKLRQESGLREDQRDAIDQVINQLHREQELTVNDEMDLAEQASMEDKKGNISEENVNSFSDVIDVTANEPISKGLKERLNDVQYNQDSFYGADIQQVRIEYEIEQLNKRITSLKEKEKGKLSFKEAIELQSLVAQVEQLNEMLFNIELSRSDLKREEKLERVDAKVSSKQNDILEERARQANSNSKLFKYVSARKEANLTEKLTKLQAKMGKIQSKQRQSALLKFDKQNNKLSRKAKRQAVKKVIATTTKDKIEKLRNLKNRVIREASNIANDIKNRFVHKPEVVNDMQNEDIIITEPPVEIVIMENPSMSMQM